MLPEFVVLSPVPMTVTMPLPVPVYPAVILAADCTRTPSLKLFTPVAPAVP